MIISRAAVGLPKLRYDSPLIKQVTPAEFRTAYSTAKDGNPAKLYAIMDWFLSMDGHLSGVLQSRISAITSAEYSITPQNDTEAENNAVSITYQMLTKLRFDRLVKELLKCHYYGARAIELIWGILNLNGRTVTAPLTFRKLPHDFIYTKKINKSDPWKTVHVGAEPLISYPPGKVLYMQDGEAPAYSDTDFTTFGHGLSAIRFSIIKYFNFEDWAAFNEIFGMPLRLGIIKQGATDKDIETLENAVQNLGSDAAAVVKETTEISFPETQKTGSINAYETLTSFCNREISTALTSESLTSSDGKVGTYGAMQTANGIRIDVAEADASDIDYLIQDQLINVFWALNFNLPQPQFKTNLALQTDLLNKARVDRELFEMGLDFSVAELRRKYDVAPPEDEADRLVKPSTGILGL
jgi:phage gp29-like protein